VIAVSPFSRGGHVSHVYGEHASVVKFIERNWRLKGTLSARSRDNLPNAWRLNPFGSGNDALTNQPFNRLFSGIQVDIAVRDTDAWILIFRLAYNIALLGRIIYVPIIIT
jgi:hypothetical protein